VCEPRVSGLGLLGAVGAAVGAVEHLALQGLGGGAGLLHEVLGLGGDGLLELAEDGLDAPFDLLGQVLHLVAGLVQLGLDLLGEVAAGHLGLLKGENTEAHGHVGGVLHGLGHVGHGSGSFLLGR